MQWSFLILLWRVILMQYCVIVYAITRCSVHTCFCIYGGSAVFSDYWTAVSFLCNSVFQALRPSTVDFSSLSLPVHHGHVVAQLREPCHRTRAAHQNTGAQQHTHTHRRAHKSPVLIYQNISVTKWAQGSIVNSRGLSVPVWWVSMCGSESRHSSVPGKRVLHNSSDSSLRLCLWTLRTCNGQSFMSFWFILFGSGVREEENDTALILQASLSAAVCMLCVMVFLFRWFDHLPWGCFISSV